MIILPDKNAPRVKLLLPVHDREWRAPSQRATVFGIENVTRFRLTARVNDGHVVWRGWFDDRADADAFLWAMVTGSLQYEPELWRLPTPMWCPDLGDHLAYDFATVTFLTSGTSYSTPGDWNNAVNTVECVGGGSGGCSGQFNVSTGVGGGGGAYAKVSNLTLAGSITYAVGSGSNGSFNSSPTSGGGDTYFNGASLGAASVGANGGSAGTYGSTTLAAGGLASSSVGTTKYNGGSSATGTTSLNGTTGVGGTGGGGAAGLNGAGNNGSAGTTAPAGGAGGSGDAGSGGSSGAAASNGGAGTEWDGSHGSGGGGGGSSSAGVAAGTGGLYGAGGGGGWASTVNNVSGGNGKQGLVVITYTPSLAYVNLPMLGM